MTQPGPPEEERGGTLTLGTRDAWRTQRMRQELLHVLCPSLRKTWVWDPLARHKPACSGGPQAVDRAQARRSNRPLLLRVESSHM